MAITCRSCDSSISEERVNPDSGVACCQRCGMLWRCVPAPERSAGPRLPAAADAQWYSLTVEDQRLTLEYPIRTRQTLPIAVVLLVFAVPWWGFLIFFFGQQRGPGIFGLFSVLFSIPFWIAGIVELLIPLYIIFGRVKVTIEPTRAQGRWALGPLGWTRRAGLDESAICRWHERPFIATGSAARTRRAQVKFTPPMELRSRVGSLGFGVVIAPERRAALAGRINEFLDRANSQPGALIIPRSEPPHRAICPHCRGDLGPAAISILEMRLDCPHCGQSAPLEFEHTPVVVTAEDGDEEAQRAVPRPEKTKIVIEHPRRDQMAIFVPKHGFRGAPGFLLFFSLFWSAISLTVFGGFVFAMISERRVEPGMLIVFPMGILFIGIGAGMFYFAVKMARSQKLISIERDRLVLRTTFMNRNRDKVAERKPGQFIAQVVAYSQNDSPVYKLQLQGTKLGFGSEMDQAEKDWLEYEINRFLKGLEAAG